MNKSELRYGNFTSSEIVNLMQVDRTGKNFGKPAITYINETNWERKLGRSITEDIDARPLAWGKLLEKHVFELLGTEYKLISAETTLHPKYDFWSGSPDGVKYGKKYNAVIDIKCPKTLKSFCQMVDCLESENPIEALIENHKDGEKYFYQLVSNAILLDVDHAELIIYMPYKSELEDVRETARNWEDDVEQKKFYWVHQATDEELPYLVDGGYYKNINIISFQVTEEMKAQLTANVVKASELLIKRIK